MTNNERALLDAARLAGRHFSAKRKVYRKLCPVCGEEFEGIAKAIYDKPACRAKAHYRRQRSKRRKP